MEAIFYYDFGSPNAYLAHRVIPGVESRTGKRFRYVPVLLGGLFKLAGNQAPMIAFAGIPNKLAYELREMERFITAHQLTAFRMNPHFPVNTLMLMRGAVAAIAEGAAEVYVETMFRLMWEEGLKLDDPAVFTQAMQRSGLPAHAILARAQQQDTKDQLAANTQQAYQQGAFGIPTFLIGPELYFGKDKLPEIERALTQSAESNHAPA